MSVLCIDCGNTRVKWGLREASRWHAQGAVPLSDVAQLADELPHAPAHIVACNVAGEAIRAAIDALGAQLGVPVSWLRSQRSQCGVVNCYENPAQLGADRWAALIGARAQHGGDCIVVNAGTATTVDRLDAGGVFQGGLILPGLALMREALAGNTAGLPLAQGEFRELPRNTDDAIASGCLSATLGAIERAFRPIAAAPGALCLLSGGAVDSIAARLTLPQRRIDHLVLEGLACVAAGD